MKYMCEEMENAEIRCIVVNGEPWFKGAEVASDLGYKKPRDVEQCMTMCP